MNSTLLVLRLVPGLLLIGHGLQKLVPPRFSPPLLHATRLRATGAAFEQIGIRPALWSALVAGLSEVLGGFSFAGGLLTPVGTILIGAVMTTAILTAHARNGIWSQEGGFEFPLVLLSLAFVISALGAGSYSINAWADVSNWAGIDWSMGDAARSAIVLAIGVGAGVATVLLGYVARSTAARPGVPATG
jgi:putative oxidoreductase